MATNTHIPRLTDREIAENLVLISQEVSKLVPLDLYINVPPQGDRQVKPPLEALEDGSDLKYLLDQGSVIAPSFSLRGPGGAPIVVVQRKLDESFDLFRIEDEWRNHLDKNQKQHVTQFIIKISALCRTQFKAHELDASILADPTSAWSKYRIVQAGVLSSLQKTAKQIIFDVAIKNAEIDKQRAQRFEELETKLRAEIATERERLAKEHENKLAELQDRIKVHEDREAQFLTKEARYVSRQKQDEQLKQIQAWLENWGLTKGTSRKRWPITVAYVAALIITSLLTAYATSHNYDLLKTTDDLAKLQWWHWAALASKAFFPLAAFTTFMVYFIRWSSSWAKQHSEEEFRNRSRLIDIGRSGWLLEAVRDAHEKNAEIPTDLLRELSRNLFSNSPSSEGDIHPSAISDLMLQGLTSLRVKTADGSEVEATKAKKK